MTMRLRQCLVPIIACFFLTGAAMKAAAQSFDCAKAATMVEKAICDSPLLAELDREMGEVYRAGRDGLAGAAKARFQNAQREWIKNRNRCGDDRDCLDHAYSDRLATITAETDVFPGWAGSYQSWCALDVAIALLPDGTYEVSLEGAGANWTCDGGGTGEENGRNRLVVDFSSGQRMTIVALGTGISLPANNDDQGQPFFSCGAMAPQVEGFYPRIK